MNFFESIVIPTEVLIFFPNHKKFYLFNKDKGEAFFEAQFQIIGTFSPKSETWRFGWANRYVPSDLKRTSLRLKEFGESNNLKIFSQPKVKDEKLERELEAQLGAR